MTLFHKTVNAGVLLFAIALLASSGCESNAPKWKSELVTSITIRDSHLGLLRTVQDRSEIDELLACLESAKRVGDSRGPHGLTHTIDIGGYGRWLYDSSSGEFTVLSKAIMPVYRVAEPDKGKLDSFLAKEEPNQSLERTGLRPALTSSPPAAR